MRDAIFWYDLETTGLEPEAQVLEIACVLTANDPGFTEMSYFNLLIKPKYPFIIQEWGYDTHTANGLLLAASRGHSLEEADRMIADWIHDYAFDCRVIPGGSGIVNFDQRYLQRDFPLTAAKLHYSALDISGTRKLFASVGIEPIKEETNHRAETCVRIELEEARLYQRLIQEKI